MTPKDKPVAFGGWPGGIPLDPEEHRRRLREARARERGDFFDLADDEESPVEEDPDPLRSELLRSLEEIVHGEPFDERLVGVVQRALREACERKGIADARVEVRLHKDTLHARLILPPGGPRVGSFVFTLSRLEP
jgi:hypothetical protein